MKERGALGKSAFQPESASFAVDSTPTTVLRRNRPTPMSSTMTARPRSLSLPSLKPAPEHFVKPMVSHISSAPTSRVSSPPTHWTPSGPRFRAREHHPAVLRKPLASWKMSREPTHFETTAENCDLPGLARGLILGLPDCMRGGLVMMPSAPLNIDDLRAQLKGHMLPKQYARAPLGAIQSLNDAPSPMQGQTLRQLHKSHTRRLPAMAF